jgi:protein-serine/threonine kinase
MQNQFKGFTFVDESSLEQHFGGERDDEDEEDLSQSRTFAERNAGNRMSGVASADNNADGDFNHGMLEDL